MRLLLVVAAGTLLAGHPYSQDSSRFSSNQNGIEASAHFKAEPHMPRVIVTGSPYSADQISENFHVLPDGSRRAQQRPAIRLFRDSQGRTRRESFNRPPAFAVIIDPVAKVQYVLDINKKIAHRQELSPGPGGGVQTDANSDDDVLRQPMVRPGSGRQVTTDDLGSKTIEGVPTQGTRVTTVLRAGMNADGGELSTIVESWRSAQLHAFVLRKLTSSNGSGSSEKLINISLEEPSPELFRPPPDYRIVDEAGDFTLQTGSGERKPPSRRAGAVDDGPNPGSDGIYHLAQDVAPPVIVRKVEPRYSEEARHARLGGNVKLSMVVDEEGVPRDIKVTEPLGLGLDEAAIEAVRQWRFRPGIYDGKPVPVRVAVQVSFGIN